MPRNEAGAALLEAMIGLVILGTAGVAAIALASSSLATVDRVLVAEARVAEASAFLDVVALWSREDLDRRLGVRRQGPWWLEIVRRSESLYAATLRDSLDLSVVLETQLYRGEAP